MLPECPWHLKGTGPKAAVRSARILLELAVGGNKPILGRGEGDGVAEFQHLRRKVRNLASGAAPYPDRLGLPDWRAGHPTVEGGVDEPGDGDSPAGPCLLAEDRSLIGIASVDA